MATYAIGDLQGCFAPLQQLLGEIGYSRSRDRLWFVGDVVNRGPASLEALRFVRDLGTGAVMVLGNHDLHLLVSAWGGRKIHKDDTLDDILAAPDRVRFTAAKLLAYAVAGVVLSLVVTVSIMLVGSVILSARDEITLDLGKVRRERFDFTFTTQTCQAAQQIGDGRHHSA